MTLFGEGVSAAVVSCAPGDEAAVTALGGVRIGTVTAQGRIQVACADARIDVATAAAEAAHAATIPQAMAR